MLLKVEWDAGDRSMPANASDEVRQELHGLTRFPAVMRLVVGTDDLLYVQRVAWDDGQPQAGPEWLVFSPVGDLIDGPPRHPPESGGDGVRARFAHR